jgi:hypothetical protein
MTVAAESGNRVRHSFTALRQFETCERQFYFQRILGLPETPGPQLAVGIVYHASIEDRLMRPGVSAQQHARNGLRAAQANKGWCDPKIAEEDLINEVAGALMRLEPIFAALTPRKGPDGQDQVEVWCERFTGKVDLVAERTPVCEGGTIIGSDEGPCVIDWKTKGLTSSRYKKDHSQQLALYCLEFGCQAGAIVEIPRDAREDINIEVTRFDAAELERWDVYFAAQFAAMSSRGADEAQYKLAVRGHGLCSPRWCQFWNRCPGGAGR